MKRLITLLLASAIACSPPAAAAKTRLQYQCNLDGQAAVLTADVEGIQSGGTVPGRPGLAPIITGQTIYYAGQLVSQSARYSFVGENDYAEFVDQSNNQRFRVQFVMSGNSLLLIANPHGPQPTRYMCQRTG